jgi:hypothetical protein
MSAQRYRKTRESRNRLTRRLKYLRVQHRMGRLKRLPDEDKSMIADFDDASDALLIAFGGLQGRMAMPPFEFLNLAGSLPIKKLFIRDLEQAWYHRGIHPHGTTLLSVAEALRETIDELGVRRLIMTGNSAGGYAALVFGTLLNADVVLCFAPQTVLDLDELHALGDHRWDEPVGEITRTNSIDPDWIDLRPALARMRPADSRTHYRVFYDELLDTDRRHAERLRGIERLTLYRHAGGGHSLVRRLRDCGALSRMLGEAVTGKRSESPRAEVAG